MLTMRISYSDTVSKPSDIFGHDTSSFPHTVISIISIMDLTLKTNHLLTTVSNATKKHELYMKRKHILTTFLELRKKVIYRLDFAKQVSETW